MKIYITSVFVADQAAALQFYTEKLGFVKKTDIPLGEYRWLTVVSKDQPEGPELLLEPNAHPAVPPYCQALVEDGIPAASFQVDDIEKEIVRLETLGVEIVQPLMQVEGASMATVDDSCGNLLSIQKEHGKKRSKVPAET